MILRVTCALLACSVLGSIAGCSSHSSERELTIVGWGGSSQAAHRQAYWIAFTQQTGIPLHEDVWKGGTDLVGARVQTGHPRGAGVRVEVGERAPGGAGGLFAPLDWPAPGGRNASLDV